MIHVCSLSRLHTTVDETGAQHIVTLLRLVDRVQRPSHIAPQNHLVLSVDDITMPMDGYTMPAHEHVQRLISFVSAWDRKTPMVMHCFAGISRSTAAAYVAACALNPQRDEMQIAWDVRRSSPTAQPNSRIVSVADRLLTLSASAMQRPKATRSGSICSNPYGPTAAIRLPPGKVALQRLIHVGGERCRKWSEFCF
jgi:predicted protein tyrosine phosphatase